MKRQPIVALDIGSTKVACAVGLPHEQAPGFELVGSGVAVYPSCSEGWIADPLMVSRTIEQAVEATGVSADVSRAWVAANPPGLTSEQVRVGINLADEPMTIRTHDLDRLQQSALNQVLGIDREALLVERLEYAGNGFAHVRDPHGLCATRLLGQFHVVTMPLAARRALVQVVESAGLEIVHLTHTLPAMLQSLCEQGINQKRVLLIDAGGLTTDVGLFVDGTLQALQSVPGGGITLMTTIAKKFQVTIDQALAWSLQGMGCPKENVHVLLEEHWVVIQRAIEALLKNQPRPEMIFVSGRAALIDGFAEWIERTTGMPTSLCRSPRTHTLSDLPTQVGLSAAIGLLEMCTRVSHGVAVRSPALFNRLIEHTRTILTEYF